MLEADPRRRWFKLGKKSDKRRIERIVKACKYVIKRGSDPFEVDVPRYLKVLRSYIESSLSPEDLALDLNALENVSRIVELQGDWIKSRSSTLYFDPMLIEWKIKSMSLKNLAKVFASAWRPIVSISLISNKGFETAANYWVNLPPLKDRWGRLPEASVGTELTSIEDLIREKLALKGSFSEMLEKFWETLKKKYVEGGIHYWNFICSEDFESSLLKAYMLSFLSTYGYIHLEFDPSSRDYIIIPNERRIESENSYSITVSFSFDEWVRRCKCESKEN